VTLPLLRLTHVRRRFGGIIAVDDVSFEVQDEQIVGLIGPNGAGKTTVFNLITRLTKPDGGAIVFAGEDLLRVPAHELVRRGIARTFQSAQLFASMSVLENVLVGLQSRGGSGARDGRERALELLDYVGLTEIADQSVAGLPFATLKQIELARALAAAPRLLLLDEPASGLSHHEVDELAVRLSRLRDDLSLAILLVEHHMNLVMRLSQTVQVLDFGKLIASGTPTEVQANPAVVDAYLGVAADAAA
jgi:branched-chain amino acid transport system ATP-binding protein